MTQYSLILFLHVAAALGLFASLSLSSCRYAICGKHPS